MEIALNLTVPVIIRLNRRTVTIGKKSDCLSFPCSEEECERMMTHRATLVRISPKGKRVQMNIRMGAITARLPKLAPERELSVVTLHMEGKKHPMFLLTTLPATNQREILRFISGVFIATCFLWRAASRQDICDLLAEKALRVHRAPRLLYTCWLQLFREAIKLQPRLRFSG